MVKGSALEPLYHRFQSRGLRACGGIVNLIGNYGMRVAVLLTDDDLEIVCKIDRI